jgi:hypothetical protein
VKGLRLTAIIKSINQGISLFGPSIVSFLTFSVYIALGNNLTSAIAFTTISLYNVARFPLTMMPLSIKSLAGIVQRIFLFGKMINYFKFFLRGENCLSPLDEFFVSRRTG